MKLLIKDIRQSKNISVPKLAELTGIPRRTIQDIERRGECRIANAYIIAKALNVTLDELVSDED